MFFAGLSLSLCIYLLADIIATCVFKVKQMTLRAYIQLLSVYAVFFLGAFLLGKWPLLYALGLLVGAVIVAIFRETRITWLATR